MASPFTLEGLRIAISGAGGGSGSATARLAVDLGAHVMVSDASPQGGIHSFVRWAARKGAPDNILVNAVAPGPADTPMTQGETFDLSGLPLQRMARAEEIAAPLLFLVSPGASYILRGGPRRQWSAVLQLMRGTAPVDAAPSIQIKDHAPR